jgi:hypothetical protein
MVQRGWYLVAGMKTSYWSRQTPFYSWLLYRPPIQGRRSGIMAFYIPNWGNVGLQEPCWFVVIQDSMICFNCGGFGAGLLGRGFIQVKVLNLGDLGVGRRQHKSRGWKASGILPTFACASLGSKYSSLCDAAWRPGVTRSSSKSMQIWDDDPKRLMYNSFSGVEPCRNH